MLESAVDRHRRSVAGAGPVDEREDVRCAFDKGRSELANLDERGGGPVTDRMDYGPHRLLSERAIGLAVGGDHALMDTPDRLDHCTILVSGQVFEAGLLFLNECTRAFM